MLYLIYTSDTNNQIGTECLFEKTCKEDKDYFKTLTLKYHNVVMGRKTFESLAKPLKNRNNIVLTRSNMSPIFPEGYFTNKVEVDTKKDYIIAGGKEIYEMFWDKVDVVYHTIHKNVDFGGIKFEPDFAKFVLFDRIETEELIKEIWIRVPNFSRQIKYRYENNIYMSFAKCVSELESLDKAMQVGCLFVKDKEIISYGANGSTFHENREKEMLTKDLTYHFGGCVRRENHIPSGQNYEMCEGCDTKNHDVPSAINKIVNTPKSDLLQRSVCYMYGHYYCCQSCLSKMEKLGVSEIVISKDFVTKFLGILSLD